MMDKLQYSIELEQCHISFYKTCLNSYSTVRKIPDKFQRIGKSNKAKKMQQICIENAFHATTSKRSERRINIGQIGEQGPML